MMGSAGYDTAQVDPACAVCQAPASQLCGCEAHALEVALSQAEDQYFPPTIRHVRSWVRRNARDYILGYFHTLSEPCKDAYALHLDTIKATCLARSGPSSSGPSSPGNNNNNNNNNINININVHVARARAEYRRNIDRAWALAVKRYPEVLNHFYSLVCVSLPDDDDPVLKRVPGLDRPPKGGDTRHRPHHHRKPPVRSRCGHAPPSPPFPAPPIPPGASCKGSPAPPPPPPPPPPVPPGASSKVPPPPPQFPMSPMPPPPHAAHWQTPPPSPP
ncbi:hypothetical protein MY11210_001131 [Beauveria gryllotalpidicola]